MKQCFRNIAQKGLGPENQTEIVVGGMAFFDYGTVLKKIPWYSIFHDDIQLGKELIYVFTVIVNCSYSQLKVTHGQQVIKTFY